MELMTMDREEARELFSAYKEGDLTSEQAAALESVLERDEECRGEYESFCRLLDSLASLNTASAPPNFAEKVKGRIQRRSGGKIFGLARLAGVPRVPYELFSLILILIILTVYMLLMPVHNVSPAPSPEQQNAPREVER